MTKSTQGNVTVVVAIPTHNRPAELRTAVRSVLGQKTQVNVTVQPVVVDDASAPSAEVTLGELAEDVLIIRNDSARGPAAARNQGAAAVPADFVSFLDDDDRWLPGKVQACLAAFDAHPDAVLVFHGVRFDHDSGARDARQELVPDPIARMLHRQPPHIDGVMVPARIHHSVQFDESFQAAEDLDYLLRVAASGAVVELGTVLAVHGAVTDAGSAISIERRIEGRRRLRDKHSALFDRGARAHSDVRIGHQFRRLGRRRAAAGAFLTALLCRPTWASPWKGLLGLALPATITHRLIQRRASAGPRSRL